MRVSAFLVVALLAGCTAPEPEPGPRQVVELAGRTPGPPVHCLPAMDAQQMRLSESDRSTFVYGSGRTVWANSLSPACRFSWNDIPIFEVTGSSFCRGDLVRSVDQTSHIAGPGCVLGDFVPYTQP